MALIRKSVAEKKCICGKNLTGALNVRVPIFFFSHLSERVKFLSLFCLSSPIFNSKKWSFPFYVIFKLHDRWTNTLRRRKKIGYHKFSLNPFKLIADNQNEMKGKTTKMPADDNFPAIFTRLYTYKWVYFFLSFGYVFYVFVVLLHGDENRLYFYLYRHRFNKIN